MNCPCPFCNGEPLTPAERLIGLALTVLHPKNQIMDMSGCNVKESHIARAKLALKFLKSRPLTRFRAIVEEWPMSRIIQETH